MDMSNAETSPYIRFNTSMGSFVCELYWEDAPKTCMNFAELARRHYYDGIIFHRVIREFMIQTGDPTGTGRGGVSIYGMFRDKFEDEIDGRLLHVGAGILSMANSGPNTNSSQFFITLAPCQHLDGKHTVFGRISAGMKVIQKIGVVNTDGNDKPMQEVKIIKAYPTDSSVI